VSIGRTTTSPFSATGRSTIRPNGENRGLRRVDDRLERVDPVHAEVRHGERTALDVVGAQAASTRRRRNLDTPSRERAELQRVGATHNGDDEPVAGRDGDADVDARAGDDRPVAPRRVHARMPP